MNTRLEKVLRLAKDISYRYPPEALSAGGEDALFVAQLLAIDNTFATKDYTDYAKRYYENLFFKGVMPKDRLLSSLGLSCLAMQKTMGAEPFGEVIDKIIALIEQSAKENRLSIGNRSIVAIDDLYLVLPFVAEYARSSCSKTLSDYCERWVLDVTKQLYRPTEGLFKRSYNEKTRLVLPLFNLYNTKSNAFAILGLCDFREYALGRTADKLDELLPRLTCSLWKYARKDSYYGSYLTALSQKEASCTAFASAAIIASYSKGFVSEDCFTSAKRSFNALVDDLTGKDGLLAVPMARQSKVEPVRQAFTPEYIGNSSFAEVTATAGLIAAALEYYKVTER